MEGGQAKSKVTKGRENEKMKTSTEMKRQHWQVRQGKIMKRLEGREIMRKKGRGERRQMMMMMKTKGWRSKSKVGTM